MKWVYKQHTQKVDEIRHVLDALTHADVIWCHFVNHRQQRPFDDICLYMGGLKWYDTIVLYLPEWCMHQFGYWVDWISCEHDKCDPSDNFFYHLIWYGCWLLGLVIYGIRSSFETTMFQEDERSPDSCLWRRNVIHEVIVYFTRASSLFTSSQGWWGRKWFCWGISSTTCSLGRTCIFGRTNTS